jgi:glycosyltransferase involved in cell wall biosynthesis
VTPLHIVHLMASPFYGGPERQMLGLARHLPSAYRSTFLSFPERGLCQPFLDEVRRAGYDGLALTHNFPQVGLAVREVADELQRRQADIVCCSGYKPDIIGWRAARRVGIPVVSVSHGWTGATWKVRCYEALDRLVLRWMDAVVCVSAAQAARVQRALVPDSKIVLVRNAVGAEAFAAPDPAYRERLRSLFAEPPRLLVGAVGRLSPEKGFDILARAAALVIGQLPDVGFVVFGDGPRRAKLEQQIAQLGIGRRFVLAGFHADLPCYLPHLDLGVMSSYTEGLPVVLLEMFAAGVPAVATAVGGIPEVIEERRTGALVPPGDAPALARRLVELLRDDELRRAFGRAGRVRAEQEFSFERQARQYQELFDRLGAGRRLQLATASELR